jgi:hypothetical protein
MSTISKINFMGMGTTAGVQRSKKTLATYQPAQLQGSNRDTATWRECSGGARESPFSLKGTGEMQTLFLLDTVLNGHAASACIERRKDLTYSEISSGYKEGKVEDKTTKLDHRVMVYRVSVTNDALLKPV